MMPAIVERLRETQRRYRDRHARPDDRALANMILSQLLFTHQDALLAVVESAAYEQEIAERHGIVNTYTLPGELPEDRWKAEEYQKAVKARVAAIAKIREIPVVGGDGPVGLVPDREVPK